jgi:hypothetical protein
MIETDLQRQIQLALTSEYGRCWRNNNGEAWLGRTFAVRDGRLVSGAAQRVRYGLGPGSSDLIGPQSVLITPEMFGQRLAVFTAAEVKLPGARVAPEQRRFVEIIRQLGGIADVVHSVEEAQQLVTGFTR